MNISKKTVEEWDKQAPEWNKWDYLWQHGPRAETLRFFARFAGAPQLDVLDHGCGPGESTRLLKAMGYNAVGVDWSPHMIELAKARGVEAHVSDSQPLPFADNTFDAVFACTSLEWSAEPSRLVGELVRVTKPGGRIVAATLGAFTSPRTVAYPRLHGKPVSHNMMMPWELHRLLQEYGLEILEMNGAYPRNNAIPQEAIQALEGKWMAQAALATLWAFGAIKQK